MLHSMNTFTCATERSTLLKKAVADYLLHLLDAGRTLATVDACKGNLALLERSAGRGFRIEDLSPGTLEQTLLEIPGRKSESSGRPRFADPNRPEVLTGLFPGHSVFSAWVKR